MRGVHRMATILTVKGLCSESHPELQNRTNPCIDKAEADYEVAKAQTP